MTSTKYGNIEKSFSSRKGAYTSQPKYENQKKWKKDGEEKREHV